MLNHQGSVTQAPRLSEVLFEQPNRSFASLAALPSNVEAIEAGLVFSTGITPFVTIVGPSGWGKTHLLHAVACRASLDGGGTLEPMSVTEYFGGAPRADDLPLILDDVQDVFGRPKQRMALRLELERRVRSSRPTILAFTAPKPNRQVKTFLPTHREWTIASMGEPQAAERVLLLNQMAALEGLSVSPRLTRILAEQMHGNGRTFSGALKRLRMSGPCWLEAEDTLRGLGLLDPFFADNSAWDLKGKILRVAEQSRAHFSRTSPTDLAIYTMIQKAGLGEADAARAAGISPAAAYRGATRFVNQIGACATTASYVDQFVELVVNSLAQE